MGYIRHDAIVVTGWNDNYIAEAHAEARRLSKDTQIRVTEITPTVVNSTSSFLVAPDGSKEGWDTSDEGDRARQLFIDWLAEAEDRGVYLDWVAVNYGGDEKDMIRVKGPRDEDDSTQGGERSNG